MAVQQADDFVLEGTEGWKNYICVIWGCLKWFNLSEKGSEGGQNIKIILFFFLKKKF